MPPGFGAWAVVEKSSGRVVGTALFKPPVTAMGGARTMWRSAGTWRDVWGRGYATEIGRMLIAHGHITMTIDRLIALVEDGNARSLAVAT